MKKKEKPIKKEKEFAVSPFKSLKGMALGGEAAAEKAPQPAGKHVPHREKAPPPPKKKGMSPQDLEDDRLFLDAMSGVRRMEPGVAAPARVKGEAVARRERDQEEERVFLQAVEALKMDVRFTESLGEEEPPQRPAPVNRMRQLRRGGIRIDLQLDLHGLTRDEALENLARFVQGAFNRGQKGVLVITGKGMNSAGEPVLKAAVAKWLRENGKGMVSEFIQAPNDMGGGGAVVVFLKEKKVEEPSEP